MQSFLQTLGGLTLQGEVLESNVNKGPQRKTLERLAYVLLEKEVRRDVFAELFFPYADEPQRELRRAIKNLNAYFERQGQDEAVILERKTLKANLSTDFDLIEVLLEESKVTEALELYKGAFLVHVTRETGLFREWVFEKRRYLAKRLFDALLLEFEVRQPDASLLGQVWQIFEDAIDFGVGPKAKDDLLEEQGRYVDGLLVQIYPWLKRQHHSDLIKAEQVAKGYGLELPQVPKSVHSSALKSNSIVKEQGRVTAMSLVLSVFWLVLGLYVAFMNYGYYAASETEGFWHPTPFFKEMSMPIAPFYGMLGGGVLFLIFLLFTRELIKGRDGPWYRRLPIYDFLPERFSQSFKIGVCVFLFLVCGFIPGYSQVYFFRTFFGFTVSHAWVYQVVRQENGRTKPGTFMSIQDSSPIKCTRRHLRCMMLLHPYPAHSMWVREFVYGQQTRGDHIDFYPYWGPALIMLWMAVVFTLMVRVLLQLFGLRLVKPKFLMTKPAS